MNDRRRITKYKYIVSKAYIENWSKEIFIIDSVLTTNLWTCRIKHLDGEKMIENFYEKELSLSIL